MYYKYRVNDFQNPHSTLWVFPDEKQCSLYTRFERCKISYFIKCTGVSFWFATIIKNIGLAND